LNTFAGSCKHPISVTAKRRLSGDHAATCCDRWRFEVAEGRSKSLLGVTGV